MVDNSNQFYPINDSDRQTKDNNSNNQPSNLSNPSESIRQFANQPDNLDQNQQPVNLQQPVKHDLSNKSIKVDQQASTDLNLPSPAPSQSPSQSPVETAPQNQFEEVNQPTSTIRLQQDFSNQTDLTNQTPNLADPSADIDPAKPPPSTPPTESLNLELEQAAPNVDTSITSNQVNKVNTIANQDPSNFNQSISSGSALNPNLVKLAAQQANLKHKHFSEHRLIIATVISVITAVAIAIAAALTVL